MARGKITLRPQQRLPEHLEGLSTISTKSNHRIAFRHPAYPDDRNVFLTLAALDHPTGGLHHDTAKIACGLIAGNSWGGHFSAQRGGQAINLGCDDILPPGHWYFYLPGYEYGIFSDSIGTSYPITPNFRQWVFPHFNLPQNWQRPRSESRDNIGPTHSNTSIAVSLRDAGQCRVSGRKEQCQACHIIPVDEDIWFHTNDMSQYVYDVQRQSQSAISDINNMMMLRSDLHRAFDTNKQFVFVPKRSQPGVNKTVVHLISPSEEYCSLYHNTIAYSLDAIPTTYLFARFAWAIFPLVEPFLLRNVPRYLATAAKVQQTFNPEECKDFTVARGRRSGTGSPKKRPRPPPAKEEQPQEAEIKQDQDEDRPPKRARRSPSKSSSTGNSSAEALQPKAVIPSPVKVDGAWAPNTGPSPPGREPDLAPPNDGDFNWAHYCKLRELGLEEERQKSDPEGSWLQETSWAMSVFRNEHSARDIQAWADIDKAHRILGEEDDSRDWTRHDDAYE
ncbi:MAG: hypothetical protein Q9220_007653 [cf. Caloplaca sp. 1 TL-2023]